ncbi:AI-2E family transporter [Melissococcus plutonius]|uniref:Membrane protein n=2 Tax=Melissococcus plutonius TaxID=33970 RepID=F3YCD5_MELPT|nr:AI-2E family transporter [Melissococcus plutonius]AIM25370.1 putative membrane protein [Melissococcus plutonius S1]KMT24090.1 putative membrane protein [Melissococcus plutonius]KMT24243.1 putative membrane protein [Melissococcus plutonius]KMT25588.1 putative membrane protein [Melissococcus plutonius]KMT28735.1 putative membrane protein [Melissococcus plutonius]
MLDQLRKSKLFFWSLELLIIAAFIFILTNLNFLFEPIGTFFSTLFAPILIAGFFYYVLNPIVNILVKMRIKRLYAILLVFLLLFVIILFALVSIIPSLAKQLASLATNMPDFFAQVKTWVYHIAGLPIFRQVNLTSYIDKLNISYGKIIQQFLSGLSSRLGMIVSTVTSTTITIITVPFILFYMLRDSNRVIPSIRHFLPSKRRDELIQLLDQMNETLAHYISGQVIECLFVGTFTIIGYSLLGVRYAFLFGIIAGLTNLIPYIGPYLGLAPAVLVTVFSEPFKAILCCIVVIIIQQIDGNVIYPNVIGKSLKIHPLTIILILLVAGNLAGLLGIFLGVPFYAICRIVFIYLFNVVKTSRLEKVTSEFTGNENQLIGKKQSDE